MSRTVDQNLLDAIANNAGDYIFKVNTWTNLAAYNATPTAPEHVWTVMSFNIYSTTANAKLISENDYTQSAFTVFTIERGVLLAGIEYTIESGLYFVTKYEEEYGSIKISGSSFPNIKLYIAAGDVTYQQVIEDFCAEIGKTAIFKDTSAFWLNYQFFPTGKFVRNNKSERFMNLIKQKYTILAYEESPKNLVFYTHPAYYEYEIVASNWQSVTWSAALNLFVAVGYRGSNGRIANSFDGIHWKVQTNVTPIYDSVTWSPTLNLFVAVGGGAAATSPDGINWTSRTTPENIQYHSVTWSPTLNLFVAVAISEIANSIMTSPDGINWTSRVNPENNLLYSVTWSAALNLFVAVGSYYTNDKYIITSPDGINWTGQTSPSLANWTSVTWSPALNLFVAVADSGTFSNQRAATSPDGINWTIRTTPSDNYWKSVTWSPALNLFVAVGTYFEAENLIMTSPDGINWTSRESGERSNWNSVIWSPELGLFVAVSLAGTGSRIMTSADGINWTDRNNTPDFSLNYENGIKSCINR